MVKQYKQAFGIAEKELGVAEIPGAEHSARVLEYHQATSLKASTDEIPWCASFVNWVLKQMGEEGTNSAAARSFLKWGVPLKTPVKGCIAVFTRDGGGHVAFFDRMEGSRVYCLGGNQNNKVQVSGYPKSRLMGFRGFKA